MPGDIESYLFLFFVSIVTAIIGSKQKKPAYVCAAIGLMWTAPFIPIIVLLVMEPFMKR